MRRILIIIAAVILLIILIVGAYFLFFRGGGGLIVGPDPFGPAGDRDPGLAPVVDTGVEVPGAGTSIGPRLLQLTDRAVAKGTVSLYTPPRTVTVASSTSTSTPPVVETTPAEVEVRYIDRQSGNVYSFKVHERVLTRLSNKTLPGVIEASWTRDGSRAFVRFLERDVAGAERVSTYLLPANGEGGFFLEQGLAQVEVASTTVLTLLSTDTGSVASAMNADGTGTRTLFSSVLSSLRVAYLGTSYLAQTKPTAHLDGYAFIVSGGTFTRLLGPLRGLSTLPSPSGRNVLYSYVDRGKLYTQVLDVSARTTLPLPLATLPEKCVWTPDGSALYCGVPTSVAGLLPDDWYQGARPFSDRVWRIDMATRVATLVFDPRQIAQVSIDAQALSLDSASDVLVFMNKSDG
ncbi:MAG TPA: hypothetical protein VEA36_01255, partial [Candidatus Paceibacterota bacterium]|nr:hypothetical protein [Candidatus Paceibacterota bacterium]